MVFRIAIELHPFCCKSFAFVDISSVGDVLAGDVILDNVLIDDVLADDVFVGGALVLSPSSENSQFSIF